MKRRRLAAHASCTRRQGFVALSMLLLLVTAGGVFAGVSMQFAAPGSRDRSEHALRQVSRSADIAIALMAHTTLYPDLYGPAGAGPGHLPCPDTDTPVGQRPTRQALSRAGPNPPCGARPQVSGAVPAHITVSALRAGIDSDAASEAALAFTVRAEVINNPVGRVVNPDALQAHGIDTLATIGIDDRLPGARALGIQRDLLMPMVERRVIAWVATRLLPELPTAAEPEQPWSACTDTPGCALDTVLPAWTPLSEGVVRSRHWFWNNDWDRHFRARVQPGCLLETAACRWTLDATHPGWTAAVTSADTAPVWLTLLDTVLE